MKLLFATFTLLVAGESGGISLAATLRGLSLVEYTWRAIVCYINRPL